MTPPDRQSSCLCRIFSRPRRRRRLLINNSVEFIRVWLEKQDAYTLHRPVRKCFVRKPYTVTNVLVVWDCNLLDIKVHAKCNVNFKNILSLRNIFSKFLYMKPIESKSGTTVASAFWFIFDYPKYSQSRRSRMWLRTDKSKEFLNEHFQDMFLDEGEGIEFQVCRNPDLKRAVVERVHRPIRGRMYKYFAHKYTNRYNDGLPNLSRTTMTRFSRRLALRPRE